METETSQTSHRVDLASMNWTNLNLSLPRGKEEVEKLEILEVETFDNSTSLNRLDNGLVYEAVVQVLHITSKRKKKEKRQYRFFLRRYIKCAKALTRLSRDVITHDVIDGI